MSKKQTGTVQKLANKAGMGSMVQPVIMLILAGIISVLFAFFNLFPYSFTLLCEYTKENPVKTSFAKTFLSTATIGTIDIPTEILEMCDELDSMNLIITPQTDTTRNYTTPSGDPDYSDPSSDPSSPSNTSCSADPALNDMGRCSGADKTERLDLAALDIRSDASTNPSLRKTAVESFKKIFEEWNKDWEEKNPGTESPIIITNIFRSEKYQAELRRRHQQYGSCYVMPALYSPHSADLAFDISASRTGISIIREFSKIAKKYGWRWGGDFRSRDIVHFDFAMNPNRGCAEGETNIATINKLCSQELGCT